MTRRTRQVPEGEFAAESLFPEDDSSLEPAAAIPLSLGRSDRNNNSVQFGTSYMLKVFRQAEEGVNPDLEVGRFLADDPDYHGSAGVVGYMEYRRHGKGPITLAVLHRFVPNQGTAWRVIIDQLSQDFERVAALSLEQPPSPPLRRGLMISGDGEESHGELWEEIAGGFRSMASLLGSGQPSYIALAANRTVPAFAPSRSASSISDRCISQCAI